MAQSTGKSLKGDSSLDKIGTHLTDKLKIEDYYYEDEDEEKEEEEEEEEEEDLTAYILAQSGYAKTGPPKKEPPANPSAIKTVSAIKKLGTPVKTVRVTWAPDVYDPPPTAPDHFAKTRTERHRSETPKKSAKSKQKWGGKPAGGGGGGGGAKGKAKQVQKYGGSSNKCFQSLDAADRLVD